MKKTILALFAVFFFQNVHSQLLPSIGISQLPDDNDSVCMIPVFSGSFSTSGFQQGDTVPDFKLYDLNGDSVELSNVLQQGKPVLLVGGSYTCPVFRGKIADINLMDSIYAGLLNIYVVYTVEAHPIVDISPYSGTVWVPGSNYSEGVLFEQPETYGERKIIVDSLLAHYTISVPVLIDGPCNNWWLNYGPAPNNGYLIDTNGVVVAKHPWFNKVPDNMFCDIDSLLGVSSGHCVINGNNGNFTFSFDNDSNAYGLPGTTLSIHCMLVNNSATNNVEIDVIKRQVTIPADWQTALCADVCYAPTTDSIRLTIAPADSQFFIFYFYTDTIGASGNARLLFRNVNNGSNKYSQTFSGFTDTAFTGLDEVENSSQVEIYPNPAGNTLYVTSYRIFGGEEIRIYNMLGERVYQSSFKQTVDISNLRKGVYFLELRGMKGSVIKRFVRAE